MTKKKPAPIPGARAMHDAWKAAWMATDRRNPYSIAVDNALAAAGKPFTTYDLKLALALILSKKTKSQWEMALYKLHGYMVHTREQMLSDSASATPAGQIFLLKTRFGYSELTPATDMPGAEAKEAVTVYGQE